MPTYEFVVDGQLRVDDYFIASRPFQLGAIAALPVCSCNANSRSNLEAPATFNKYDFPMCLHWSYQPMSD